MDNIGPRLKALRTARNLSQRKLAASAGVSNATVSLIEHGRTDPSMGLLKRLLDCLGVSFAEFFASSDAGAEQVFFAREELAEISSGPGADTGQSMLSHDAEEGGIVLEGKLEVTVGEQVRVLSPGDAYRFNSRLPHRFRNTGTTDCVIVSACTPPSF